jgi:hypothetical protein
MQPLLVEDTVKTLCPRVDLSETFNLEATMTVKVDCIPVSFCAQLDQPKSLPYSTNHRPSHTLVSSGRLHYYVTNNACSMSFQLETNQTEQFTITFRAKDWLAGLDDFDKRCTWPH